MILFLSIPLAHAAPVPRIPILSIESRDGPYLSNQEATVKFVVRNLGSDQINGLNLDVQAGQGWSALSGSVSIGTLESGAERPFSIEVKVGSATFPSIVFTARSNDHMTVPFPASVFVSSGVTAQIIANAGEAIEDLGIGLAYRGLTYAVKKVGENIFFPTTESGLFDGSPLQQVLQGYFIHDYLANPDHSNLSSLVSSIGGQFSNLVSDTDTIRVRADQFYTFSVGSFSYAAALYQFLTWQIPLSQLTMGAFQDWGIPDMIAWAIRQYTGINVSSKDAIQLANLLVQIDAGPLGSYTSDLGNLGQMVRQILSATVPDVNSLMNVMNLASQVAGGLNAAYALLNDLLGAIQTIISWLRSLAEQIVQVFQSLMNWVSSNPILSLFSSVVTAINSFLAWLRDSLTTVIDRIIDAFNAGRQAQSSTQSAQGSLSDMSASVRQSYPPALDNLNKRLAQVEDQARQKFNTFCGTYEPALPFIRQITPWVGTVAGAIAAYFSEGSLNPSIVIPGLEFLENSVDAGCRYLVSGTDPIAVIAEDYGINSVLDGLFPKEEGTPQMHSIGSLLDAIGAGIPAANQLMNALSSSGYDLSAISSIISRYQSASTQGNSAYESSDYVGALKTIASLTGLPILDAINVVLQDVQSCANVQTKFLQYRNEGMVAPDLESDIHACTQKGQSAISDIAAAQYSAIADALSLVSLASQLGDAVESRHQQFTAAKSALEQLGGAISSLDNCGFVWVQPDSNTASQAKHALQLAQSQYNDGKYSDVLSTASQDEIARAKSAGAACSNSAFQAKLEVGGVVGIIGIISIVAAALSIHRCKSETEETRNLEEAKPSDEARHDVGPDLSRSSAKQDEAPKEMPTAPRLEMQVITPEERPEPRVKVTDIESLKPNASRGVATKPPEPEALAVRPIKTAATKAAQPRKKRRSARRHNRGQASRLKKPARVRRKTSRKA
jgi:hypothetical protein